MCQSYRITLSFLEIYNENIKDLLVEKSENLMILEDPVKGVTINNLSEKSLSLEKEDDLLAVQ